MRAMAPVVKRILVLVSAAVGAGVIAACTEKLEAGNSCPLLCPSEAIDLRDTVIDAVLVDTTISGLPALGTENFMPLSKHGDTLDTRVIVRYDTLPQTFTTSTGDTVIAHIDSAYLQTIITYADTTKRPTVAMTISAYNVDTTATDTVAAVLLPLFRVSRFLGSLTIPAGGWKDTVRIPISPDTVLDRVLHGKPLRVGLQLTSASSVDLRVPSTQVSSGVTLFMKTSRDTSVKPVGVGPLSHTPTNQTFLRDALSDFYIVAKGATPASPALLSVGGLPPRRTYLLFSIPSQIVDSTTIVRASLLLTQRPNRTGVNRGDSLRVVPQVVVAGPTVTDLSTALTFLGGENAFGLGHMMTVPSDSGVKIVELASVVRTWHGVSPSVLPRAVALTSGDEAGTPTQVDFFSTRSAAAVRPKLRIVYVPRASYGIP